MKRMYNRRQEILCSCNKCGRLNYVEQHGTTAKCKCSTEWTEHSSLPYAQRDVSGLVWLGPNRIKESNREDTR